MEFPFHFGQKESKTPEILAPVDANKFSDGDVTFKGVERAIDVPVSPTVEQSAVPVAELPTAPSSELPATEAPVVEAPQEPPADTDHQIPAQTA